VCVCVCVCLSPMQAVIFFTDVHQTWYGRNAVRDIPGHRDLRSGNNDSDI